MTEGGAADGPVLDGELTEAVEAWLEELRLRLDVGDRYGPDLDLVARAQQLVDDDRRREGVLLRQGRLTVERLDAHAADAGEAGLVDLEATLTYPADGIARNARAASGRRLDELTVTLGATYWQRDEFGLWRLVDYVRDDRRMSATWCTHPFGEDVDAVAGIGVVPQAVTTDGSRVGRLFLEVHSERDEPVVLRVGRPERPRGLFRRSPPVEPPEVGIPVPPHSSVHLVGRTARPRLTEVEIFAFDAADLAPVGELRVQVELARHHPGSDGQWCEEPPD
jgi:hypothetical protein